MSVHVGGRGPGHMCRNALSIGQQFSTLSAPTLSYPSPLTSNPTTIVVSLGVDWQSGNIFKLARSASSSMSSPTILTHPITDTDITNGGFSIGLSGVTLSGITYFDAYGNSGGLDSNNVSGVVSWGDSTAPVITTSASQSVYEQVPLAVVLGATDTGGVPALVSNGTTPGWYISGGADQLQFQLAIAGGVPTLQWYGNGTQAYNSPQNNPPNKANPYNVQVTAVDYGGNKSTAQNIAVTVNQIVVSAFSFTNVSGAPHSTLETSNTVTLSIAPSGVNVAASVSGTGFTYSKNGGAYQAAGSFTVQNGDTITLEVVSGATDGVTETGTLTVQTQSATWSVATPGSSATDTVGNGTTGAGTNKSKYINSTSFQAISMAAPGQAMLDRSDVSQANVDWYIEGTINGFGSGGLVMLGVDDGSVDLNGGGTGWLGSGVFPGNGSYAGFTAYAQPGATAVHLIVNGSTSTFTLPSSRTSAIGDTIGLRYNSSTKVVTVYYYSTGFGDLGQVGTATLSSNIPSSVYVVQGGVSGNGTVATSDTLTTNYGGSSYVRTAPSGSTYFA